MQRKFIIGSEWVYFKIYSGTKTADAILEKQIDTIIQKLNKEKIILKWFFIRYHDPDAHLRVRFLLENKTKIGTLLQLFYQIVNPLVQQNIIWKIQIDTYNREIERYSEALMEFSESLFTISSQLALKFLKEKKYYSTLDELLFGMVVIDNFVKQLITNSKEIELFYKHLYLNFKTEFLSDAKQNKVLDIHFRTNKSQIINTFENPNHQFQYLNNFFKQVAICKNTHQVFAIESSILASHTHMIINRLYNNSQRKLEFIIYDYLYRYYKFLNHQKIKNIENVIPNLTHKTLFF